MRRVAATAVVLMNVAACQAMLDFESFRPVPDGRADASDGRDGRVGPSTNEVDGARPGTAGEDAAPPVGPSCRKLEMDASGPANLALSDTHVYFIVGNRVLRAPKQGTTVEEVFVGDVGPFVASSGNAIFWGVNSRNDAASAGGGTLPCPYGVVRFDVGGTANFLDPACDPRNSQFGEITVDAAKVFWINTEHDLIASVGTFAGAAQSFATDAAVEHIAVSKSRIYWAEKAQLGSTIHGESKTGAIDSFTDSFATTVSALGADLSNDILFYATDALRRNDNTADAFAPATSVTSIRTDGTSVYWAENGILISKGLVSKYEPSGGVKVIAAQQVNPRGLALDDTHVYWLAGAQDLCSAGR